MGIYFKYANHYGYTDVNPYEIIKVVSDKTIVIREMNAEEIKWKKEIVQGGFSHRVTNQNDQKWNITSNENAPLLRIRLNKSGTVFCKTTRTHVPNYIWKDSYGNKYHLSDTPVKFYDYNF